MLPETVVGIIAGAFGSLGAAAITALMGSLFHRYRERSFEFTGSWDIHMPYYKENPEDQQPKENPEEVWKLRQRGRRVKGEIICQNALDGQPAGRRWRFFGFKQELGLVGWYEATSQNDASAGVVYFRLIMRTPGEYVSGYIPPATTGNWQIDMTSGLTTTTPTWSTNSTGKVRCAPLRS